MPPMRTPSPSSRAASSCHLRGSYVPLPGKGVPKIVRRRYDMTSGGGPVRKATRGNDSQDAPVWMDPFDI
eukprot:6924111-Alexandrium_andersonii.AAC.1